MKAPQLWTFGHSTRTVEETVELLRAFGVDRVVDVRSIRGSRHNPWFGEKQMPGWLADAGLDYRWIPALGGRRRKQHVPPNVNGGWQHASFHSYADWTLGDEFEGGLVELGDLAADAHSAIMCAEAVPWRCHRSLIATVVSYRGWHVRHIMGVGQVIDHVPGRWGAQPELRSDGKVVYPAT